MTRPNPRNLVLGWRNRLGVAALTGAGWQGLGNLSTDYLGQSASHPDPDAPATIAAQWPAPEVLDLVCLVDHNLSTTARVRVVCRLAGALVHDSGWVQPWPSWSWGSIPFGDPRWWGHSLAPEDIAGLPPIFPLLLPNPVYCDRLEVTVEDPSNAQGFIDLPLCYAGPVLQVSANFDYGAVDGWAPGEEPAGAADGVPLGGGDPPRQFRCTLSHLTDAEGLSGLGDLVRVCGRGGRPFLVLPDPGDAANLHRVSMWGFLVDLPDLERARQGRRRVSLTIRQWRA